MRIASHTAAQAIQRALTDNRGALQKQQILVSNGNAYARRSEAPLDASEASRVQQAQRRTQQHLKAVENSDAWVLRTETELTRVLDLTHRVNEISIRAGDAALADDERHALAEELDDLLEDLVSGANAKSAQAYLFGGTDAGTPPVTVTRDADGKIDSVAYSTGSGTRRRVQVDDTTVAEYGSTATGAGGVFRNSGAGSDLFDTVIGLRDTIADGGVPTEVQSRAVVQALDGVTRGLAETGLQGARLEALRTHHKEAGVRLEQQRSDLQDVDMAAAIGRLSELEASLEASMRMAAAVNQLTLAKFI